MPPTVPYILTKRSPSSLESKVWKKSSSSNADASGGHALPETGFSHSFESKARNRLGSSTVLSKAPKRPSSFNAGTSREHRPPKEGSSSSLENRLKRKASDLLPSPSVKASKQSEVLLPAKKWSVRVQHRCLQCYTVNLVYSGGQSCSSCIKKWIDCVLRGPSDVKQARPRGEVHM
jgi:hypothetical protein